MRPHQSLGTAQAPRKPHGTSVAGHSSWGLLASLGARAGDWHRLDHPRAAPVTQTRLEPHYVTRKEGRNERRTAKATADTRSNTDCPTSPGQDQLVTELVVPNALGTKMPQFLELKDKFGNSLFFGNGGDVRLAATPLITDFRKQLKDVQELYLRHDDIIIAGYPKSGNHWHQQIVRMLIQNSTEYTPNTFTTDVLEYIPESFRPPATQPRVFFSHLLFRHLPRQVTEKRVKIVYLTRNPKDTFVSMYAQLSSMSNEMGYSGTWDQFFQVMLEWGFWHGNYFDHLLDWEKEIEAHPDQPVFVSSFEDMKRDPLGQIEKLNEFLGVDRSHQLCARIASVCDITSMRAKEEAQVQALRQVYTTEAPVIYRKGEVGDWKNWFTPEQNEQFDEVYRKRMNESKRTFVFE